MIKGARFEAHRRRVGEGGIEHGLQRLAEERFALGGLLFAGDANPALEHIDYLRAQRFHRAVEFFVDHGVFLHIKKIVVLLYHRGVRRVKRASGRQKTIVF